MDVGVAWDVKEDINNALIAHCNANPSVSVCPACWPAWRDGYGWGYELTALKYLR